ncbi:MAG: serine protease [Hyphomicrobium sp.]
MKAESEHLQFGCKLLDRWLGAFVSRASLVAHEVFMFRWLTSVFAATTAVYFVLTAGTIREWARSPSASIASMFEVGSLYFNATTAFKRDRLASIERAVDFSAGHPIRKTAAAVGMLSIEVETEKGKRDSYSCTAVLIRTDLVITNRHCVIRGNSKTVEVTLWLDHTTENAARIVALDPVPVESDAVLDYALLRIRVTSDGPPIVDLGKISVRAVSPGERLFIIHHSNGDPQQVTRAFCRADLEQSHAATEISHSCPTRPGSSGALVFADSDGAIVGLHRSIARRTDIVRGYASPMISILGKSIALAPQSAGR